MKVTVYGSGHLADATREVLMRQVNVTPQFELVPAIECEVFWCCIDMPVSEDDESHVDEFLNELDNAMAFVPLCAITVISTQVPVGTLALLEKKYPKRHFATQPENIRKAHAAADLQFQTRVIVGTRHELDKPTLTKLFKHFTPGDIHFMSPESAEMTKHAINSFLAMEIAFINEIAAICEQVGADAEDVSLGLRTDKRTGHGPLRPGDGYRGGTLGRDVVTLGKLNAGPLLSSIKKSNDKHLANMVSA